MSTYYGTKVGIRQRILELTYLALPIPVRGGDLLRWLREEDVQLSEEEFREHLQCLVGQGLIHLEEVPEDEPVAWLEDHGEIYLFETQECNEVVRPTLRRYSGDALRLVGVSS